MSTLNTALLREKFIIHDSAPDTFDMSETISALSNRLVLDLTATKGSHSETFIIRTQNMYSCVRMAARLYKSYKTAGPLLTRAKPFEWEEAWNAVVNDYEYRFNENRWCVVYSNGRPVFQAGEHHMFLDVIEQCDARNKDEYEASIKMAEDAFKQAGKVVKIEHQSNVALVIDVKDNEGKFGVILRSPSQTTTFNFSTKPKKIKEQLNVAQCLAACASFLEGVQIAFTLGMNNEKMRLGLIERFSQEEKHVRESGQRLGRLNGEISNLERTYDVRYRPEKPEFHKIVVEAEKLAQQIIRPPEDDNEDLAE